MIAVVTAAGVVGLAASSSAIPHDPGAPFSPTPAFYVETAESELGVVMYKT
ncbi:hypothetical protein ABZV58_30900 [Nocardia sp. NPDC004654]|uniref:hypothetical protein n=1 Tax=Nocardia sp. NPDC004654 TaxID=3154776 RepID=UPI0033AAB162